MNDAWAERPVFVLGAGFSKAINDVMPVTSDLEHALASEGIQVPSIGLEAWLGHLSERQPHVTRIGNLENAYLAAVVLQQIAATIRQAELSVRASPPPDWLLDFIWLSNALDCPVVSFNYDPLFDAAKARFGHVDGGRSSIRVHGSVEEGWDPEVRGEIVSHGLPPSWGITRPDTFCWEPPGRLEPFIVPPVSIKSPFYGIPEIRDRWLQASAELQVATNVSLFGYSMPPGDYAAEFMIGDVIRANTDEVRVNIADLDPKPVASRVATIGGSVGWVESGPRSIAAMVERMAPTSLRTTLRRAIQEADLDREVDVRFTSAMSIGLKFPETIDPAATLHANELPDLIPDALSEGRLDGRLVVGARRRGWTVRQAADGTPIEEIEILVSPLPEDFPG